MWCWMIDGDGVSCYVKYRLGIYVERIGMDRWFGTAQYNGPYIASEPCSCNHGSGRDWFVNCEQGLTNKYKRYVHYMTS